MGGKGSGDSDLDEEQIIDRFAFCGVAKGLAGASEPEGEKGVSCLCLFFEGEKGLEAEEVSVLTARDLGMIDMGISDLRTAERGGVEGG
jgi:hypothetical protein